MTNDLKNETKKPGPGGRMSRRPYSEIFRRRTREGHLTENIRFYARAALLIVNKIGYLSNTSGGTNLFFRLMSARYKKGPMILTSNRGVPNGPTCLAIPSSQPRFVIVSCTMPSCRSREPAIGCVSMSTRYRNTRGSCQSYAAFAAKTLRPPTRKRN